MADGVAITAGSGTTILTDDTGAGGHAQVVKLAISTDGSGTLVPADAGNGLDVDVTRVQGTVTVAGAVTNAGTFVVQENGAALTSLQLIDDVVVADDAAFTPATTKVLMAGFTFDDVAPDSVNEGDGGAARMSANRNVYTTLRDAAGNERGLNVDANGAVAATVTNATATNLKAEVTGATAGSGTATGAIRVELPTNGTGVVGLNAGTNAIGKLAANSGVDIGDVDVTTVGTVTPGTAATSLGKAEDAAHTTGDVGVYALAVRSDTPTVSSDTTGDYSSLNVGARGELWVGTVRHDTRLEIATTIAGLTAAATAYTAGDVMGTEMTFANAARISAGGGTLRKIVAINNATQLGAVDLFLFDSASTPAADNAANSWSDANMAKCVGIVPLVPTTSALNQTLTWVGDEDYSCAATSLFGVLVTRSGHTFFGAATDILVRMWVDRA